MNIRKNQVIIATALAAVLLLLETSFAEEPPPCGPQVQAPSIIAIPPRMGPPEPSVPPSIRLLNYYIQINVISELTGLTQDNVKQLLINCPAPAVLDAYVVSPEAFSAAYEKQASKLIGQAVSSGLITKKQEEELQKRMSRKHQKPSEE